MSFNTHDITRDACMLNGRFYRKGYDWWWHSFTGYNVNTGKARQFFIEFFVCNPAKGGDEPVFGQLPENRKKGIRPSYLMVKAGAWGKGAAQLHRFFGWNEISAGGVPFSIQAYDCFLDENRTCGRVEVSEQEAKDHPEYMSDAGVMEWDLSINKKTAFNVGYGAGKVMRFLKAFQMFWHAEGMKTAFSGEVVFNGEKYRVSPEDCYGYADKNWGSDFTSPWLWLSSNDLTSTITGKKLKNSAFDIGGGCPKIGPFALDRKLLSAFWYEGTPYEFNFSKFWTVTRTKFFCRETEDRVFWHVEQKNWLDRVVVDIVCDKKDMLLVNYEAPDGRKRHNRLWNGGNGRGIVKLYHHGILIDRIRCEKTGCEYGEYDRD